jgi:hypothetical protein
MEEMRIDIVDHFIQPDRCHFFTEHCKQLHWNIGEYDVYNEERYLSGMSADLDEEMRGFLDEKILTQAKVFTGLDLNVGRAYINAWKANEPSFPHIDACNTTCLIYVNLNYDAKYGGETIFYDKNKDAQYAITPYPGRAVFFDGNILHRASSFNHLFNGYRHTIAYKLGV